MESSFGILGIISIFVGISFLFIFDYPAAAPWLFLGSAMLLSYKFSLSAWNQPAGFLIILFSTAFFITFAYQIYHDIAIK